MPNQYFGDSRRRAGPTGFSSGGNRTALGYWLPLVATVGVATVGLAAWVWSERQDDDYDDNNNNNNNHNRNARIGLDPETNDRVSRGRATGIDNEPHAQVDDTSVISRVHGALRRTPSPQEIYDGASKRLAAGVAAVGGALTSIREEDRGDFEDHSMWAEEGPPTSGGPYTMSGALAPEMTPTHHQTSNKRKTVAIVLSAVSSTPESGDIDMQLSEHSSMLAHLLEHVEPDTAQIFVLIYAPGLPSRSGTAGNTRPTPSITSSYSNIAPEEAAGADSGVAGPFPILEPRSTSEDTQAESPFFNALYNQAQALVDNQTMIMPFGTPTGHVHILRHLSPDTVYIQENLTGNDGDAVQHISGWTRQVVVVVGDEGGSGGLVDSDDESALAGKDEKWWQKEHATGLGKRVHVVDGLRIGEDWKRRVSGHE